MTLVASPYFEGDKRIGVAEGEYCDGSPCFEVVYLWADTESYRDAISTLAPRRHFGSFAKTRFSGALTRSSGEHRKQWRASEQWSVDAERWRDTVQWIDDTYQPKAGPTPCG